MSTNDILTKIINAHSNQSEYIQAVREVIESIEQLYNETPIYQYENILHRIIIPDRVYTFKIPWKDDQKNVHVNIGYRVQFNNALGPYKGGLRFHPSVNLSILKFLGFEQIFKNALTGLPMGGAKGGSDFDPKGKSDDEIMRFCQAFMTQMWKFIGSNTDIPAGDIGVGTKEIGYMFGIYKKLADKHTGVLTGKGTDWGGSLIRPQATGFGNVYFANEMLHTIGEDIKNKTVAISGFGNVAWGAATKANQLGAKVIGISGPDGYIYDPEGISGDKIHFMLDLRATNEDIVRPFSFRYPEAEFFPNRKVWELKADIALPSAIQNELDADDAKMMIKNGVMCVSEGANMPCTPEAIDLFQSAGVLFGPGKAANAGGVSTSGLELTQNAMKLAWNREEVDQFLHRIIKNIHKECMLYGKEKNGKVDYVKGANIAAFTKIADSMIEQGLV